MPSEVNQTGRKMWSLGILLLLKTLASSYTIIDDDYPTDGVIVWPSAYYLKGEKIDLSMGIEQTFEIWYSAEMNRSRISFYDRLDSTYYYGATEYDYGREYKVFPKTSENLDNFETCYEDYYEKEAEDFLPSVEDFVFTGVKIYNDKLVEVFELPKTTEEDVDEDIKKAILYVFKDVSNNFHVPVRYELKNYSLWTKALTDHQIIEYKDFKLPEDYDLDVSDVQSCVNPNIGTDLKKALKFYNPELSSEVSKAFHAYKNHHKRQYDMNEHKMRQRIFQRNWRKVIAHNKKNLSYKMEINHFSDRTPEELKYLTATLPNPQGKGSVEFPHTEDELEAMVEDLPEYYNMKLDGVISRVKNQGNCGACWAFSATAVLEGALARSNGGRDIDLSEQSILDCAWGYNNYGCEGGYLDRALRYVLEHGIPSEREYGSYLAQNGKCAELNMTNVYNIKGFARVTPRSVNAMKVALYKYGPVAVSIYASDDFRQYSSGIFFDPQCDKANYINHAVTAVGYGVRDGALYWIVKNSYGEDWGQDGYVLMSATNDNCFVLTEAYYPIV